MKPENTGLKRKYCGTQGTWPQTVASFFILLGFYAIAPILFVIAWNVGLYDLFGARPLNLQEATVLIVCLSLALQVLDTP